MKFPGVARTFIVKIAAGLPSGEYYKRCALAQMNAGPPLIFFLLYLESCFFFPLRYFPGDVLHHSSGILQAAAGRERLPDGFFWHRPNGKLR